ncbi:MAG TPA: bifunctional 5,10-methylenetetrahydrofolate dehydrogenase/5,10-methenyltetrahydrofolate cyclohydrolase [Phycisphaerae bacterium]|nr:bifunctional 5,10-methylenetetrahydrofolate dehydrogenase/5,10-methenyltetrahydrofolate cyclohydrolase [Phycisphaerae bacterium]HOJ72625.1 bifunctional 5,10-methylenetetrahydrofolate dehydrogenase/5,10-methenyltetrahydrofolate cyclohydrolase [Phycisphaerae bacterium]HOM49714.1 bifunctional 5,10-methylenetetrahydrofolate dehydrogenase/5,10-methenyltetrahydrofolate cyclohydrolase [Phycisphaerae bacterium]HON69096.1 bifunctional 5,10-methylenetetrahydrofolate dehydrogenase/5,10-methenyltetrahydr
MAAELLDGNRLAERIQAEIREQVDQMRRAGRPLKLVAILVGEPPASMVYARSQARQCERLGIEYELVQLPVECDAPCVLERIDELNADPAVTGIMLHLPLPPWINPHEMQYRIDPYKDVEGVNPANIGMVFYNHPIIAPCTALAVIEIINETKMPLRGVHAVVVGQGAIVGRPISVLLAQRDATVTACNEFTPDLASHTARADLLVVAAGKAGLITAEHVKPGAVVIDVGINRVQTTDEQGKTVSRTVGDVDFESVLPVAGAITPVPGGVGPVTVTMLLRNTVEAAKKQAERKA